MNNTMNNKPQVFATNEILGATLMANMSQSDVLSFGRDPRSFIASSLNVDTGDISLQTVENSAGMINLALPYYSVLDSMSADFLDESDVGSVSGGEIIAAIIATAIAVTATTAAVAVGGALGGAAITQATYDKKLDGSSK